MAKIPNNLSRADQVRARRKIEKVQRKPIPRTVDEPYAKPETFAVYQRSINTLKVHHPALTQPRIRQRRQSSLPTLTPEASSVYPPCPASS